MMLVAYPGCGLTAGWKQQPAIPVPLGPQPFCCAGTVCLLLLTLFLIYITLVNRRLIYRPECNNLNGEICVLHREPIFDPEVHP